MIVPFKDRTIDPDKKVEVYLNLHKKDDDGKSWYSIRQQGKVIGHADTVALDDVEFIVGVAGRDRVRNEQRKNVHAWVKGCMLNVNPDDIDVTQPVLYNPYKHDGFVDTQGNVVKHAGLAKLTVGGTVLI